VTKEECKILIRCWIPEQRLRTFIESVVRIVGIDKTYPPCRPPRGAVWLEEGRLDEDCWLQIRRLLDLTCSITRTWMGFTWTGTCEARCDLQIDTGYDGVSCRIEISQELASQVRDAVKKVGGGVGMDMPDAAG
jgi:hypothetical protein